MDDDWLSTQELFTKLLESSSDMFVIGNGNLIEYESASVRATLGRSFIGDINFSTLTHPDDVEHIGKHVKSSIDATIATGKPAPCKMEMRVRTSAGVYLWVESCFCFSGTRFYAVWRDISSAKKAQRCMHDFLNTTSHDARTPLSSIKVACELLVHSTTFVPTPDARELLTAVAASTRVLLAIVQNVMLKKRLDIDNGKCDITVSAVDIRALAADVVRTASVGLARQSGTTIVLHADDTLPQSVESSAEHLELLLLNLTVFCVRASEALPVCVSVRCDQADAAVPTTMRLVLEVCVRGQALSAEQAEAAFEPYAQDSTATAEALQRASQSRLGLHVSRRLVEALGGRLTIRSSEEDGTCFTACIPVPPTQQTLAPLSRAASFTQAPAFEEDPDDPGIRPFLPPELEMSASFTALRDGGHMPELFDLLLANSDDGFYIGDNITFRYASPGLLRMLQYEDAKEEMYSIPILEFLHPDDLPSNAAAWEESKAETATRNGAAVYRKYMYRIRKRDGSYLWIEAVTVQTPETFYGMMRDIDDRKSLESSLKEFLTSTMSDFRQPLTGIAAAAELLAQQDCVRRDADAAFMVAAIASATRMLSGIVANVLSMRSLEAGDCEVADAPFSIRDCMAGVLSVCRMSLTHSDSTAIRWVDEEAPLPALVRGDADRFAQILLNLCSNAVKFADGSNITVSVRCESVGDSSTSMLLSLRVTDGGRGMSEAERDRAFESYVRAPTHMGGGTGLGLYICKRFAEAMGGSISVDTAPGCGACFTVSVPVVAVAPDAAAAAPPMPPTQACNQAYTSAGAAEAGQPMDHALLDLAPAQQAHALATQSTPEPERRCRVLLVDDHGLNLRLCRRLLETAGGLQVITADDGDVALRILIDSYGPGCEPVDIVLMDMQMPRMDGLAATRAFRAWESRERPPPAQRLPIVALSANVFDEKIMECAAAGMDGFLAKPLRLDALRVVLREQGLACTAAEAHK